MSDADGCLCDRCAGLCCRYFALPIDNPETRRDYDNIRWYLLHERVVVFVEDGQWFIGILNKCKALQPDNRCGVYETRPTICRGYSTDNCDYHGGDYGYQHLFTSAEALWQFAEQQLERDRAAAKTARTRKAKQGSRRAALARRLAEGRPLIALPPEPATAPATAPTTTQAIAPATATHGRSISLPLAGDSVADRSVHYEAAFEGYLRHRGIPYVAVDEAKRALFATAKLKSFDFVVYSRTGPNLLVDVKGRSCRNRAARSGFETWSTEQDVTDLTQWAQVFGDGFKAVLMFVYWVDEPLLPDPATFEFRNRWYLLMGVDLDEYRNHMRRRSAKWATVALPADGFRQLARPIDGWV